MCIPKLLVKIMLKINIYLIEHNFTSQVHISRFKRCLDISLENKTKIHVFFLGGFLFFVV